MLLPKFEKVLLLSKPVILDFTFYQLHALNKTYNMLVIMGSQILYLRDDAHVSMQCENCTKLLSNVNKYRIKGETLGLVNHD